MKNIILLKYLFFFTTALIFSGCVSIVEKTGQALDGSAFAEKRTALYRTEKNAEIPMEIWEMRNKAGENSYLIMLHQFPAMKIRISAPDYQGEFNTVSLEYLGGNTNGWNEFQLNLYGQGILKIDDNTAKLSVPGGIEPVQISQGRIRRYETRITGNDALTGLRNRRERILAVTEWMNDFENTQMTRKNFERHYKPILFPETVRKNNRPQDWLQENDNFIKAEDIRWNTGYTERVFPEILWNIRNSGTMLRDWEEAIEWLYIEYNWERILEQLSRENIMFKTKR